MYYGNTLWESEVYQTNYTVGWVYYNYPDNPRKAKDAQEVFGVFSFPNLLKCGIVPSYTYVQMWQAEGGSCGFRNCGGAAHVVGLGYDMAIPGLVGGIVEQNLHLSADFVYNDGVALAAADHDWSHAVFGASTGFPINKNLTFTPGLYYQSSWDDSVNTSDEYWTKLSMTYKF